VLLLDKPGGCSSNRALQIVKRLYDAAKAGHTGSLDPLATGMLPICFGSATRLGGHLLGASKRYRVVAALGTATDTADADGAVIATAAGEPPDRASVEAALRRFVGEIEQVPPMYSALKQGGVRLYELARRGESVERAPRRVTIHAAELERYAWPELQLTVHCSKGTYVRSLVVDVAAAVGTLGHVRQLRRLAVEPYDEGQMHTLEALEQAEAAGGHAALDALLLPLDSALPGMPAVKIDSEAGRRFLHGQPVVADPGWPAGAVRVYLDPGTFVAIGEIGPERVLRPRTVFSS
jgi:tRNA pseudouridine55 synthase